MAVLWVAWCITVIGWLLVPIINFLLSKLFAYLDFDIPRELKELELYTVPPLHQTLRDVTEERMLGETKDKQDKTRPPESHLKGLQERENLLKSALDEAEDILDLVEYHRIQKEAIGDKSIWQHLHDAVDACIAYCKASWSGRWIEVSRAKLLQWSQSLSQKFKDIQAKLLAADSPAAQLPTVNPQPAAQPDAPSNPATSWPTTVTSALRPYWDRLYEALGKMITTCYQLILSVISALPGIYSLLCSCRDWSYEVIGIQVTRLIHMSISQLLPKFYRGCLVVLRLSLAVRNFWRPASALFLGTAACPSPTAPPWPPPLVPAGWWRRPAAAHKVVAVASSPCPLFPLPNPPTSMVHPLRCRRRRAPPAC